MPATSIAGPCGAATTSSKRQAQFGISPGVPVGALRVAEQQKVEILRALAREAKLIVMDEPTAALTGDEAQKLLEIVRELRDRGTTIVYVSHFLEEVLSIADDVTVLRDGAARGDGRGGRQDRGLARHSHARAHDGDDIPTEDAASSRRPGRALRREPRDQRLPAGRLAGGSRGRDRGPRRPRRQRPHRGRPRDLRRGSNHRRHDPPRWQGGTDRLTAEGGASWASRSCPRAGSPRVF